MKSLIIVALLTLASATASARPRHPGHAPVPHVMNSDRAADHYEQRLERQYDRIDAGITAGQITVNEARKLEKGQRRLGRAIDRAVADGLMFPRELAKLDRLFAKQSGKIEDASRNRMTAFRVYRAPVVTRQVVIERHRVVRAPVHHYRAPVRLRTGVGVHVARTF